MAYTRRWPAPSRRDHTHPIPHAAAGKLTSKSTLWLISPKPARLLRQKHQHEAGGQAAGPAVRHQRATRLPLQGSVSVPLSFPALHSRGGDA